MESIAAAFPNVSRSVINDDLAYPAMLSYLPTGLLGLVIASLIAALMSTLSTHLNWGSSYVVHDWYHRFVEPDASEDRLVLIGRISTVALMVMAAFLALALTNALQAFSILLQIGAGTGLIFILRWFWWRINAYTEIAGMFISFAVALFLEFGWGRLGLPELLAHEQLLLGIAITTVGWLSVTFATRPTDMDTLRNFYLTTRPGGPGWGPVVGGLPAGTNAEADGQLPLRLLAMLVGAVTVYAALFATGFYLYDNLSATLIAGLVAVGGAGALLLIWNRLNVPRPIGHGDVN